MLVLLIIKIIHLSLIAFILATPFFGSPAALIIHVASVISILIHWNYNNDACFLTLVESSLRGVEPTQSFIHRIVSPVYKFTELDVNNWSYILLTILALISITKLYKRLAEIQKRRITLRDIYGA